MAMFVKNRHRADSPAACGQGLTLNAGCSSAHTLEQGSTSLNRSSKHSRLLSSLGGKISSYDDTLVVDVSVSSIWGSVSTAPLWLQIFLACSVAHCGLAWLCPKAVNPTAVKLKSCLGRKDARLAQVYGVNIQSFQFGA